jgi:hypothetical protein
MIQYGGSYSSFLFSFHLVLDRATNFETHLQIISSIILVMTAQDAVNKCSMCRKCWHPSCQDRCLRKLTKLQDRSADLNGDTEDFLPDLAEGESGEQFKTQAESTTCQFKPL